MHARLLRHPALVLAAWAALTLAAAGVLVARIVSGAPLVDNSVGIWFMADDPALARYENYLAEFGEREWTLLLLETGSIYDPDFLADLGELTARIEALDHVTKVTSIANVRDNLATPDGALEYSRVLAALDAISLDRFRGRLNANPLFDRSLFQTTSDNTTVILIQNDNLIRDPAPYRIELVDRIDSIVGDYPSIRAHALAGTTVVNAELNRASQHDVLFYYTLISLLLAVVGRLVLRNLRDVAVMLAAVTGSVLPAMAAIALAGVPFNMVTVMMPVILVALSIAGVIHVIKTYHQARGRQSHAGAVLACRRILWRPVLWTSVTTAAGFATFALSSVAPVLQLGIFATLGIALGWVAAVYVAPAMLDLLWARVRDSGERMLGGRFIDALLNASRRHPRAWLLLFAVLLTPLYGLGLLRVDTDYTAFFSNRADLTRAYDAVDAAGYGQNPLTIALYFPDGASYASDGYFQGVVRFERAVAALPEVIRLLSATELLLATDRAFNGEGAYERLPGYNKAQVDQLLWLGELSGNDDFNDFLTEDKGAAQIVALTPYLSSQELNALIDRLQHLHREYLPADSRLVVTGTTVLWANMDRQISATQLRSLGGMGLFLCVLLPLMFRSLPLGLVALPVNVLPLAITLGLMGLLGISINMATVLIGAISLGVVVDDTIHFMHRFTTVLKEGMSWNAALDDAHRRVGHSIVSTTVVLVGGFLAMATSSFLPTAHFGVFLSLSLVLGLFLDLFILPAMLKALGRPARRPFLPKTHTTPRQAANRS
ncbi:MAG: efflux RND transporter permease subunit, partial [Gammaproteobacteria bacterium]